MATGVVTLAKVHLVKNDPRSSVLLRVFLDCASPDMGVMWKPQLASRQKRQLGGEALIYPPQERADRTAARASPSDGGVRSDKNPQFKPDEGHLVSGRSAQGGTGLGGAGHFSGTIGL